MDFTEYQEIAFSTCTPECYTDDYLDLGYLSEVGELAGKLAKQIRGDDVHFKDIMHEIGDIAWMIAVKARLHGQEISTEATADAICLKKIYDLLCPSNDSHNLKAAVLINVCEELGFDFQTCLQMNIDKLASRRLRGVIQGDGDYR